MQVLSKSAPKPATMPGPHPGPSVPIDRPPVRIGDPLKTEQKPIRTQPSEEPKDTVEFSRPTGKTAHQTARMGDSWEEQRRRSEAENQRRHEERRRDAAEQSRQDELARQQSARDRGSCNPDLTRKPGY